GRNERGSATDGAGYAQQVHMTAAHERHPGAATNGACHGDALLVRPAGGGQPLAFAACGSDSTSPPGGTRVASQRGPDGDQTVPWRPGMDAVKIWMRSRCSKGGGHASLRFLMRGNAGATGTRLADYGGRVGSSFPHHGASASRACALPSGARWGAALMEAI